jgi:hypothetical protein
LGVSIQTASGRGAGRGGFAHEALGVLLEGCGQDALPVVEDIGGEPVVDHVRRQHGDAAGVMLEVVPEEESLAMNAGVFQRAEAVRELGPVFRGLELASENGLSSIMRESPLSFKSSTLMSHLSPPPRMVELTN